MVRKLQTYQTVARHARAFRSMRSVARVIRRFGNLRRRWSAAHAGRFGTRRPSAWLSWQNSGS